LLLLLLPVAKESAHTGVEDVFGLSQDVEVHGRDAANKEESTDCNIPLVDSIVVDRSIAIRIGCEKRDGVHYIFVAAADDLGVDHKIGLAILIQLTVKPCHQDGIGRREDHESEEQDQIPDRVLFSPDSLVYEPSFF
jgi:hypothetical protein